MDHGKFLPTIYVPDLFDVGQPLRDRAGVLHHSGATITRQVERCGVANSLLATECLLVADTRSTDRLNVPMDPPLWNKGRDNRSRPRSAPRPSYTAGNSQWWPIVDGRLLGRASAHADVARLTAETA